MAKKICDIYDPNSEGQSCAFCYYVVSSPIYLKLLGILRRARKIHVGNVIQLVIRLVTKL